MPKKTVVVEARMGDGFAMESTLGKHVLQIDQPDAMGGTDTGPNPLQYFLLSLGGCIGAIARIIASQKRLEVRGLSVSIRGEIDTDALLGKNSDIRAGFESITADVHIDADMTEEEKKAFLAEVEARCPISDNMAGTTPVTVCLQE